CSRAALTNTRPSSASSRRAWPTSASPAPSPCASPALRARPSELRSASRVEEVTPLRRPRSFKEGVCSVAAGAEDQWLAVAIARTFHAAEEDHVITARHVGLLAAFEGGERTEQQRTAAEPRCVHDVIELVGHPLGEMLRKGELPGPKHVHGKMV